MALVKFKTAIPMCANPETYLLWKEVAHRIIPHYGFCTDCTPEYQQKMIKDGRCEHPETLFEIDSDGFIAGTLKKGAKA